MERSFGHANPAKRRGNGRRLALPALCAVLVAGLALFTWSAVKRLRPLLALRRENRLDQPALRLSGLLRFGFGQKRLVDPEERTAGVLHVVVQAHQGRPVGLVVDSVLDVVEEEAVLDASRVRPGVAGCAVLQGRITEVLDTGRILALGLAGEGGAAPGREADRG